MLGGTLPHPTGRENPANMSEIWLTSKEPEKATHITIWFLFFYLCRAGLGRVEILHISHITDPLVIWPMRSRVEKGPLWLFIPIILCHILGSSKVINHLSCEHVKWIKLLLHPMCFYLHFIFIKRSSLLYLLLEWFCSLVKMHVFQCPYNCLKNRNFESKIWKTVKIRKRS